MGVDITDNAKSVYNATTFAINNEDSIIYGGPIQGLTPDSKVIRFENYSNPYELLKTISKTIKDYQFIYNKGIMRMNFTDGTSIDIGITKIDTLKFNEKESEC